MIFEALELVGTAIKELKEAGGFDLLNHRICF